MSATNELVIFEEQGKAPGAAVLTVETTTSRQLLQCTAAWGGAAALPFLRHARAADVDRFALGVASGHARPTGVVLWTRLLGLTCQSA